MSGNSNPSVRRFAGELTLRQFFAIVGLFWLYVTLSNVLYAYGMRTGIAHATNVPRVRAVGCARAAARCCCCRSCWSPYWASCASSGGPCSSALPLQIILAHAFAALAYPAMISPR